MAEELDSLPSVEDLGVVAADVKNVLVPVESIGGTAAFYKKHMN